MVEAVLTKREKSMLDRMASEGGMAGSGFFPPEWIGGRGMARRMNQKGLIRLKSGVMSGALYVITSAGRAALEAHNG